MKKKELKIHTEAEIVTTFHLKKIYENSSLLVAWLNFDHRLTNLSSFEQNLLQQTLERAKKSISFWSEEDLKMYFISDIIKISGLVPSSNIAACFDRKMEAKVDEYILVSVPDFTMAKGVMDLIQSPYFHFHEYKKDKASSRDPLGQLLKAFMIGSAINNNEKPLYGAYIIGRFWYFVVYDNNLARHYSVSKAFDSTEVDELIKIIAILRHFKVILETVLM